MKNILLFLLLAPINHFAQQTSISIPLNPKGGNDVDLQISDEVFDITTTGENPYLFTKPLERDLDKKYSHLAFEYFCPTGVDFIEIHFYPEEEGEEPIRIGDVGSTEGWVEFKIDLSKEWKDWGEKGDYLRIDFGPAPNLKIQLRNIKIRALTEREKELQKGKEVKKAEEAILLKDLRKYLDYEFENEVTHVLVTKDSIHITGEVSDKKNLFLVEVSPYEHATQLTSFEFVQPVTTPNRSFKIALDRVVRRQGFNQDRVLSKWMLVQENEENENFTIVSHARHADSIVPVHDYSFVKPSSKKGLGGYSAGRRNMTSDLDELDITSVTVNVWVNHLFRSKPSPENIPFDYMGETYYINKEELEKFDETFISAANRNIEVSAILLIAKAVQSPDQTIGEILQHPDTDPAGIYSMPNVTTPEGVQYYAAFLDFLAKRYSRPDKKFGRIHHYIIHNEVDAGWVWTNVGEKEALVFMDLYQKSMRMSYNIARKYNPNSKVFISLTHYWNWTSNPRFYHSKELLEQLLDFSKAEGDFEWAIAQHPYPESLREPKVWLDKKVSFDFDTKLITFKNIEVLNAWVKQPEVLYKGQKRTVYLSENGTNSPTYDERDLKEQAAGLAYALKKLKYLDGIDGFQYHNWQDNRGEGGLRIGLRRFPDATIDPGGKKPAWYVYEAFGTPEEKEVFAPYKEVIGIETWEEVRYKGPISNTNSDKISGE